MEAIQDRQSVRDTWSDEMYVLAYERYAHDTTGSLVAGGEIA